MISERRLLWGGFALAALIALALAPFASEQPDSLEHAITAGNVAAPQGTLPAPLPDYRIPGVRSHWLSTALAGLAGIVAVVLLLGLVVRPRRTGGK